MSNLRWNLLFAMMSVVILSAVVLAADTQPPRQNYGDRYNVLSERNIFMRERGRPAPSSRPRNDYSSQSQPAPVPEATYVLTGIVLEEGQYRAYVEEAGTGRVHRLAVGDAIARGHVLEIDIDAIAYSSNGKGTWVSIGNDLLGKPFSGFPSALSRYLSSGAGSTTGPSTTGPSAGSSLPIDPNSPNLSIEERMRLRRLQGK
jgi:hypothetical protein